MKSMTGFGRGESTAADFSLAVELNAVNRRNLEISFSLPREWQSLERDIAEIVRGGVGRGKVHATVRVDRASGAGAFSWDRAGVEAFLDKAGALARGRGIDWPPDGAGLVSVIALHRADSDLPPMEEIRAPLLAATRAALGHLNEMRSNEGAHLAGDLSARLERLRSLLAEIRVKTAGTVGHYRELLMQRLKAAGLELDLDDERVSRKSRSLPTAATPPRRSPGSKATSRSSPEPCGTPPTTGWGGNSNSSSKRSTASSTRSEPKPTMST